MTVVRKITEGKLAGTSIHELFPTSLLSWLYPDSLENELNFLKTLDHSDSEDHKRERRAYRSTNSYIIQTYPKELSKIRNFIREKLDIYTEEIIGTFDKLCITQNWFMTCDIGLEHPSHLHPNSILSGILYFQDSDNRVPGIKFMQAGAGDRPFLLHGTRGSGFSNHIVLKQGKETPYNCYYHEVDLKYGQLLIIPSNLMHWVTLNSSNTTRYSFSFNTWSTHFGSEGTLNELDYDKMDDI